MNQNVVFLSILGLSVVAVALWLVLRERAFRAYERATGKCAKCRGKGYVVDYCSDPPIGCFEVSCPRCERRAERERLAKMSKVERRREFYS